MEKSRFPAYGGQALIEGVLMRGASHLAVAMRAPDGSITLRTENLTGIYQSPIKKIPFLRGLLLLWDALVLGTRYLTISANVQANEDDEKIEGASLFAALGISFFLGIGLFFVAPAAAALGMERWLHVSSWMGNLIEGIIRLAILIGYMWIIGKSADIARVFGYHGAEHKTINAFEAGETLTPENVAKYSLEHPRCGTSFLLTVVVLSILVFSLLGPLPVIWRLLSRILLIPVLATLAYEYIRWIANHLDSSFIRLLVKPNLALQHLTTREPDLKMIEVALAAFNAMYALEHPETAEIQPVITQA